MTELTYENFADHLRASVPGFDRVYDEHVRDCEEVLPHVLLGDLVVFLLDAVERSGRDAEEAKSAVRLLEAGLSSSDEKLQELIGVSFAENLEPLQSGSAELRSLFGPKLEREYKHFWS